MKTVVVNLKKREDRLASFKTCHPDLEFEVFHAVDGEQVNYGGLVSQGFDVRHDWIDPILNTRLTRGRSVAFYRIGVSGRNVLKEMKRFWYWKMMHV